MLCQIHYRHYGEDTGVVRKNFPFAWVFFLYSQTLMSNLLPQCCGTDDEAVKGLELPSVILETFQPDEFPRKFTDFLA